MVSSRTAPKVGLPFINFNMRDFYYLRNFYIEISRTMWEMPVKQCVAET